MMNFLLMAALRRDVAPPPPAFSVQITDQNIFGAVLFPGTAIASYRLVQNGQAQRNDDNPRVFTSIGGEWLTPGDLAEAANYECRFTFVSKVGSSLLSGGPLNVFLDLDFNQEIEVLKNTQGASNQVIDVEIRRKSTTINLATARITMSVEVVV